MANLEQKSFAGGALDLDSAPEFIKPNNWIDSLNIRVKSKSGAKDEVVSNISGNTKTVYTLPSGTNTCIGSCKDEVNGHLYYFVHNSNSNDLILRWNVVADTITKILINKTDTGTVDVLNFSTSYYINHANVIDGILYWTDGLNEPRKINVAKAIAGTYGVITATHIAAAKKPSTVPIACEYLDDTAFKQNLLKRQLFQFSQLFIYDDKERSAWSTHSKMVLPDGESDPATDTDITKNNYIQLTIDCGDATVDYIEVAMYSNNGDPYLVETLKRSTIVASGDYDAGTNTYTYKFYNNGAYVPVDTAEFDLTFDRMPQIAGCQELVNGNNLVYADITEGYDNVDINLAFTLSYVAGGLIGGGNLIMTQIIESESGGVPGAYEYIYEFEGTPQEGDVVFFRPSMSGADITYTVLAGDDINDVLTGFKAALNAATTYIGFAGDYNPNQVFIRTTVGVTVMNYGVTLFSPASPDTATSFSSIKLGSSYSAGIVYYDKYGRHGGVNIGSTSNFKTDAMGVTEGAFPRAAWSISSIPPIWAHSYQLVFTKNRTHQNFLYFLTDGTATTVTINDTVYYDIPLTNIGRFNTLNPSSTLSYEFSANDRVAIHKDNATWIEDYDVEVVSYDIETSMLRIRKKASVTLGLATKWLIELYTPLRSTSTGDDIYYEVGERYAILNPGEATRYHAGELIDQDATTAASGIVSDLDVYAKRRTIPFNDSGSTYETINVEDPHYSDFYISNYWSNGRGNIYSINNKQINLYDSFRFSQTKQSDGSVNGLSRFYEANINSSDIGILRQHGKIKKISLRNNQLITFQQLKVGVVPVLQNIWEDQTGSQTATVTQQLLNGIRYLNGNYGIGNIPESHCATPTSDFFADPNNGVYCEIQNNFIREISRAGVDSYFTTKLKSTYTKVLSSYDQFNDEVNVTFLASTNTTLSYDVLGNKWNSPHSFIPEHGVSILDRYVTFKSGELWVHDTASSVRQNFYGVQYGWFIKFVFNGSPTLTKAFKTFQLRSNALIVTDTDGIVTSTGQVSDLVASDFAKEVLTDSSVLYSYEGVYKANLMRDKNSPDGIIDGDQLLGNYCTVKLASSATTEAKIFTAAIGFVPSYS